MNKRKFIIEPLNGLANRLRVIDSAIEISREGNFILDVFWGIGNGVAAKFEDLIQVPININRVINYSVYSRLGCFKKELFLKASKSIKLNNTITKDELTNYFANIYLPTCERICGIEASYNWLSPNSIVREKADQIIKEYQLWNKVGVHIRRCDNTRAKLISTTDLFIKFMKEQIEHDSGVYFFVCCDDESEIIRIKRVFGKKIIARNEIERTRITRKGAIDALIDMLCLSSTKFILGSHWSSFSIESAKIGKINYFEVK